MDRALQGIPASPGIVVGPVHLLRWEVPDVATRIIGGDSIPGEIDRLRDAIERAKERLAHVRDRAAAHAGPEEAATLRGSRHCPDPESVRHLMEDAGFRDARTRARTLTRRLPGIADFVLRHLAATPVAGAVAALSPGARAALAGEVSLALRPYADGDGIVFPEVVNVVTAVR